MDEPVKESIREHRDEVSADEPVQCPYCGTDDVLPFESEEGMTEDYSFFVIIISAFLLIVGYFVLVVSSYMYFPYVLFAFVIISAKMVNRREKKRKKRREKNDYLCVECGNSFYA